MYIHVESQSHFHQMIKDDNWKGVENYLSSHPNYNLSTKDSKGNLAFHYIKTVEMANVFLEFGFDISQMAARLNYYIHEQNEAMIDWMLSISNLDVNVEDSEGETPLFTAIVANDFKTVKVLLLKGASCR